MNTHAHSLPQVSIDKLCKNPKTDTCDALIKAAINVFGRDGFAAASTRSIADEAGVNQALINYHFKTKQGLYLAVFEYINGFIESSAGTTLKEIEDKLAANTHVESTFYWKAIKQLLSGLLHTINSAETKDWASLITREQQHPTAAFTILENGAHGRIRKVITRLIARQLDLDENADEAKLISLTFMGQLLMFKIARATVLSCMEWEKITEQELKKIESRVFNNFAKILNVEAV